MPYDQTAETAPAGNDLQTTGDMEGGEVAAGQEGEIHIPSDLLPPGIKEGDVLRCTAMDENGCTFEHEPAKEMGPSWDEDFRSSMSPQKPEQEAS